MSPQRAQRARVGGHSPINLWVGPSGGGEQIGMAMSPEWAARTVEALNAHPGARAKAGREFLILDGINVWCYSTDWDAGEQVCTTTSGEWAERIVGAFEAETLAGEGNRGGDGG